MSSSGVWDHLALVTPPPSGAAGLVVSVADAMQQCRVTPNGMIDETAWFQRTIFACQRMIDGPHGAGVGLLTQQWRLSLDRWPVDYIQVPLGPVQSIDAITYLDVGLNPGTLPVGQYDYDLDADPVHIRRHFGVVWPLLGITPGAAKVKFTTGFGATADAVPEDLKHAVLLLVSHFYNHRDAVVGVDNRDSSGPLPLGVDSILDRYRVGRIA